jgi:hypothetical protein
MAQKLKIDIVAKDRSKQALQGLQGSLGRIKASVFNLRNAFIGLGAGLVIRNIVNTGKQIENLQVQLKFLFGSAQEGAKAFDEMAKFAAKVPFSLEEIQKGSGVLAVVSKDAKELANLMKITGNVAAVTGLDFKTTAEQIQRSLSAGISAADLFRDKGVKDMLGFKAGATVSVEETVAAFERVFGEGGRFDGATDELAKTFSGTLSMIGDKVFNFKRVLLDAGFFSQLKAQFGDLNKSLEQNSATMDKIAITIGTVLAIAVEKVADGFKFMAKHSREFGIAIKALVALKIGIMLINWGRALIPIVASMRALVSLSGVGLALVAASVTASVATFLALGKALDDIEEKINKNFTKHRDNFDFEDAKAQAILKSQEGITKEVEKQIEPVKKIGEEFRRINEGAIAKLDKQIKNINTTIATGISSGITKMSDGLARSIILGEKLSDTFRKMASELLVRILSTTIEVIARKGVELAIEKLITREKAKQWAFEDAKTKSNLLSTGMSFLGLQHGGAVSKGTPTLVGERGPEMFIPNTSGQITQSARGTGGGSVNVNFTINTIDSRGFDEALVANRGTIASIINNAMNEKGSRGVV